MNRRPLLWTAIICLLIMFAVSAYAWVTLPAGSQIPTHFGVNGRPDAYSSKAFGLLFMPLLSVVIFGLLYLVPAIDPRRTNIAKSATAYNIIAIGAMVLLTAVDVAAVAYALGSQLDIAVIVSVGVGLLFVAIGFALPRLKSSYLVGIRTPWTLTSDLSWRKTHVLGGWLFIAFGVLLIATGLWLPTAMAPWILFGGIAVIVLVPTVYSYVVWRSDPDRRPQ